MHQWNLETNCFETMHDHICILLLFCERTDYFVPLLHQQVWNKICLLWCKVVDVVTGRVDTTTEQLRIVPLYLLEQMGWFQRPRQIASYR